MSHRSLLATILVADSALQSECPGYKDSAGTSQWLTQRKSTACQWETNGVGSARGVTAPKKGSGSRQPNPLPEGKPKTRSEDKDELGWGCAIPGSSSVDSQHYNRQICGVRLGYPKDSPSKKQISTGFPRVFTDVLRGLGGIDLCEGPRST